MGKKISEFVCWSNAANWDREQAYEYKPDGVTLAPEP